MNRMGSFEFRIEQTSPSNNTLLRKRSSADYRGGVDSAVNAR